jgi:stage V sporulation protein D (sporulation-specific penicillin-binding protein)
VSKLVRCYLKTAVQEGSCRKSQVPGYLTGGKTGTAEKIPRGNRKYILSFIGFAPVEDPQVVIYCLVDEPDPDNPKFTSTGCILFHMIAEDLLPYMNIYKTDSDDPESEGETEMPVDIFATDTDATQDDIGDTGTLNGNGGETDGATN